MPSTDRKFETEYPYNIHHVYEKLKIAANTLEGVTFKSDDKRFSIQVIYKLSLWSLGEVVTVDCHYIDDDHTAVYFKSEPKAKTTLVDWGKGQKNIQEIVNALNHALYSSRQ